MANGKTRTIEIDQARLYSLLKEVAMFSAAAESLRKQIASLLPAKYGSDAWWEQSDKKALKEIQEGKGKTFSNIEEFKRYLGV